MRQWKQWREAGANIRFACTAGDRAVCGWLLAAVAWIASQQDAVQRKTTSTAIFPHCSRLWRAPSRFPRWSPCSTEITAGVIRRVFGVEALLATRSLAGSLRRTSVLVGRLSTAIAVLTAVGIMVGSFRETVAGLDGRYSASGSVLEPGGPGWSGPASHHVGGNSGAARTASRSGTPWINCARTKYGMRELPATIGGMDARVRRATAEAHVSIGIGARRSLSPADRKQRGDRQRTVCQQARDAGGRHSETQSGRKAWIISRAGCLLRLFERSGSDSDGSRDSVPISPGHRSNQRRRVSEAGRVAGRWTTRRGACDCRAAHCGGAESDFAGSGHPGFRPDVRHHLCTGSAGGICGSNRRGRRACSLW